FDLGNLSSETTRVIHWQAGWEQFLEILPGAESTTQRPDARVQVRALSGLKTVDLAGCIDPGLPITSAFDLLPVGEVLSERQVSQDDIRMFLADPTASWLPYGGGVPYPRHTEYRQHLLKQAKRFSREGFSASFTAWLPAEDGAGATTTLRQVCFDLAREGYPVLVARPDVQKFDFQRLSTFLTAAANRFGEADVPVSDVPWVIAFDAEHVQLHWDFLAGL